MHHVNSWLNLLVRILILQTSTLNHKLPGCLHQPLVDCYFEISPHHCLLLRKVVDTSQDSESCQEGLHHLYKWEVGGFQYFSNSAATCVKECDSREDLVQDE